MEITLKQVGARLKRSRVYLNLSQKELSEKVNVKQAALSRLENGIGGNIHHLITILNFFSQYIYIDLFFSDSFELLNIKDFSDNADKKSYLNQIAVEKLKQLKKNSNSEIEHVIKFLSD